MKTLLMGLVIAFISMAVLIVSGCKTSEQIQLEREERAAKIASEKCGPGKLHPQAQKLMAEGNGYDILSTSPVWSSSGTSAIFANSSGTSGCGEQSDEELSAYLEQQKFVAFTIDNLSEDIARGGGPHLRSLTALLGCPASDYPALADMARQDFRRLFPSTEVEPGDFLARLKDDISHDSRLAVSCTHA